MIRLNSHELRAAKPKTATTLHQSVKKHPIVFVLDNIVDTYNLGSFFRLAEALAIEEICLCGSVVTPPNIKIHRASIGTWKFVTWRHFDRVGDCIKKLRDDGYSIVACEQANNSIDYLKYKPKFPLAIIFGNEQNGVAESTLKNVDHCLEIPMYGINKSLNVLVSASVLGYHLVSQIKPK